MNQPNKVVRAVSEMIADGRRQPTEAIAQHTPVMSAPVDRKKLRPLDLIREKEFMGNVKGLAGLAYSAPWLYFGFTAFLHNDDARGFLWRIALAVALVAYNWHAVSARTGAWYALDLWERSLHSRFAEWKIENPEAEWGRWHF